ncbi:PDGLE domain-containing protein [Gordonia sp. NPDC003424]
MTALDPHTGEHAPRVRRRTFLIAFALAALLIAGILSYFASQSPDGLDSATLRGCETVQVNGAEQLTGTCIAQHATDHAMASSPLADYGVKGIANSNGLAGIIGVLVVLAIAAGAFWLISGSRGRRRTESAG